MNKLNTKFLTGLRGYSALAVFLIHSGGAGIRELGKLGDRFVDFGKYGVISFFILSAVTLSVSISRSPKFNYCQYLIRRLTRIVPLYALVMLIFWTLGGSEYYLKWFKIEPNTFKDIFLHLSFLNIFDIRYKNSIIGVEWTVPIEMWTYLLIPPLFFIIMKTNHWGKVILFILALIVSLKNGYWYDTSIEKHWAIDSYLFCFIGGIIIFSYWDKLKINWKISDVLVIIFISIILLMSFMRIKHVEQYLTVAIMSLILLLAHAQHTKIIFENKLIVFIGNISFPLYLIHTPILKFLSKYNLGTIYHAIAGLIITSVVAYILHNLIEKPTLRLTGKLHPFDK